MARYFALCGAPEAGKTEVQKILHRLYGVMPIDDKRGLRDAAKALYGLTEEDVSTQAGKRKVITVGGKGISVRELLGNLGKYLEDADPLHFPRMARRQADEIYPKALVSFGSVRMGQGAIFQGPDSLVIEVSRPGYFPKNDFDHYDASLAHVTIHNDYDAADAEGSALRLEKEVIMKISPYISR